MSNLQIFNYNARQVRTVVLDGEPHFVAADVCGVLDQPNVSQVVARLEDDEKGIHNLDTPGGRQDLLVVSESGLYSLILGSRKPEAKMFKRWVIHEVLPAIRKTGRYELPVFSDPDEQALILAQEVTRLIAEKRQLQAVNAQQSYTLAVAEPKVQAFDQFLTAENWLTMNEAAKSLAWGRNRLFEELRNRRILIRGSNLPYQQYLDAGYFRVRQVVIDMGDRLETRPQTLVSPRGLEWLRRVLSSSPF